MIRRFLCSGMIFFFFFSSIMGPNVARAQMLSLPEPGTMLGTSPAYMPVMIKGLKVHPENPLLFDFILDTGKSGLKVDGSEFKAESNKLIKYFLASLTIKEDDLWVNLSPYEKDRMITEELGKTELGRDMLAQDYILKQLTASLIYPEKELGKAFWDRVYAKAQEQFGSTDVPVDTFNKVWIVADKAKVLEHDNAAYVVGSHLKVMLEEDYLALEKETAIGQKQAGADDNKSHTVASQIIREVIIPEIEKEVNQGKNFAPLRQMFYSMILASWYKIALKDALLNQVYSNKAKTGGVLSDDPSVQEKIYTQYLEAYKKGVFNYIKEDVDAVSQQPVPKKYFSGGERINVPEILERSRVLGQGDDSQSVGDLAMASVRMAGVADKAMKTVEASYNTLTTDIEKTYTNLMKAIGDGELPEVSFTGKGKDKQLQYRAGAITPYLTIAYGSEDNYTTTVINNPGFEDVASKIRKKIEKADARDRKHTITIVARPGQYLTILIQATEERAPLAVNVPAEASYNTLAKDIETTYTNLMEAIGDGELSNVKFTGKGVNRQLQYAGGAITPYLTIAYGSESNYSTIGIGKPNFEDVVSEIKKEIKKANASDRKHTITIIARPGEYLTILIQEGDAAMGEQKDFAAVVNPLGGIDLNAKNMGLDVAKDGKGIQMKLDPAMIAEFQRGDFSGVVPVIIQIVPIQNPLATLGLNTLQDEGVMAKG